MGAPTLATWWLRRGCQPGETHGAGVRRPRTGKWTAGGRPGPQWAGDRVARPLGVTGLRYGTSVRLLPTLPAPPGVSVAAVSDRHVACIREVQPARQLQDETTYAPA